MRYIINKKTNFLRRIKLNGQVENWSLDNWRISSLTEQDINQGINNNIFEEILIDHARELYPSAIQ